MASYVVTGVSRGIGYAFLRRISADPNNTFIGIVRDRASTLKKISEDDDISGRSNIHILQADMTDRNALKKAAEDTAKITGGSIDYLIANAGYISDFDTYDPIGVCAEKPDELEAEFKKLMDINVLGVIHLYISFLPLILKGQTKKVILLTSGHADIDATREFDLDVGPLYAISKAGANTVTAKFSAQYKQQGVLFLSLGPGIVATENIARATPEQLQKFAGFGAKVSKYAPNFTGPITPDESVQMMQKVYENASIENGDGGAAISHYGNKQWV